MADQGDKAAKAAEAAAKEEAKRLKEAADAVKRAKNWATVNKFGFDYVVYTALAGVHAAWLYQRYEQIATTPDYFAANPIPWWEPVSCVALYLLVIGFGYKWTQNRQPMDVTRAMAVYNVYLTLLSFVMMVAFAVEAWGTAERRALFWRLPLDKQQGRLAAILWVNYQSKHLEFLDTVWMVVKKNYQQMTFLHVQHHAVMSPIMWLVLSRCPGGESYFGPLLNSAIHTNMYLLYGVKGVGYATPRAWDQSTTQSQMLQFVAILGHTCWHLYHGTWNWLLCVVEMVLMFDMLALFGAFYIKKYTDDSKKAAANAAAAAAAAAVADAPKSSKSNKGSAAAPAPAPAPAAAAGAAGAASPDADPQPAATAPPSSGKKNKNKQ